MPPRTLCILVERVYGVDTHSPPPWSDTLLDSVSLWSEDSWALLSVLAPSPITQSASVPTLTRASKSTAPHITGNQSIQSHCHDPAHQKSGNVHGFTSPHWKVSTVAFNTLQLFLMVSAKL